MTASGKAVRDDPASKRHIKAVEKTLTDRPTAFKCGCMPAIEVRRCGASRP